MALRRQRVNTDLEDDILTALITSTPFIEKARRWYQPQYMSDYGQIIAGWVFDYWATYREAPGTNIQNIYNVEKEKIPHALAANVATYLQNLSEQYTTKADFNLLYMVDQAREYFKTKSYEYLYTQGRDYMLAGQVDEAIRLHDNFRGMVQATSRWENPFDPRVVQQHFAESDEDYTVLKFRGALGQLIGPLERGWFVAWMGPMKRGKSFWLQESMFAGATGRKRVAVINLEMIEKGMREREYTRLTGLSHRGRGAKIQFPVFDCFNNQVGECPVPTYRTNGMRLRNEAGDVPRWGTPGYDGYEPCTTCRDNPDLRKHFIADVWYTEYTQDRDYERKEVLSLSKGFVRQYGDRIRQITYPAYTVSISGIQADLEELAYAEGFWPDIVLVDYADIVEPERYSGSERDHLNSIWKAMKRAAGQQKNLWMSATQTNRKAITKDRVHQTDTAEDIRKLAHVDAMFAINQTEQEKEDLITRIGTVAHRHRKFGGEQAMVLHQLDIGIPYIDSEWV